MAIDNNNFEVRMDSYFTSGVYTAYIPSWLKDLNKHSNKYIREVRKENLKGGKKDFGGSHCSYTLIGDNNFSVLADFIIGVSRDILIQQGYDLSRKKVKLNDYWVQEFSKLGGGHQSYHVHSNAHMSGFYFLKCSDKTSFPIMHDPRAGAMMTKLPQKDRSKISTMSDSIHYRPKPGTLIFFPAYVPHEFAVDDGVDDFRFIHFNLQAVRNIVVNAAKGMK